MVSRIYSGMKSFAAVVLSAAIFTLATACGGSETVRQSAAQDAASEVKSPEPQTLEAPGDASSVLTTKDGTSVLVLGPADVGRTALTWGKLSVNSGCLGLRSGSTKKMVAWPAGTRVTQDPTGIILAGKEYHLGDKVEIGGGFAGRLKPSSSLYKQIPTDCQNQDLWLAAPLG